ncbi:MAG: hypothetical protein ACKVOS_03700 [Sphingorhabdus sp.]|uniref:hypothetical protein n=1 Tax=Sphingorhabdus sp. TaxID=1902408 RepID=UPI0038FD22F7
MINPARVIVAILLIAAANGILMGLGNRAYELVTDDYSIIEWPGSFYLLFWYTAIFATFAGMLLAPVMLWVGSRLPLPKLRYLIMVGLAVGPLPFIIMEGLDAESFNGLLVFSLLGAFSAFLWWLLVEKHRSRQVASD